MIKSKNGSMPKHGSQNGQSLQLCFSMCFFYNFSQKKISEFLKLFLCTKKSPTDSCDTLKSKRFTVAHCSMNPHTQTQRSTQKRKSSILTMRLKDSSMLEIIMSNDYAKHICNETLYRSCTGGHFAFTV